MSEYFHNLVIIVPVETELTSKLFEYLSNKPFRHTYIQSGIVPDKHKILIEGVPASLVEQIKSVFRDMYKDSKYVGVCQFHLLGPHEFI